MKTCRRAKVLDLAIAHVAENNHTSSREAIREAATTRDFTKVDQLIKDYTTFVEQTYGKPAWWGQKGWSRKAEEARLVALTMFRVYLQQEYQERKADEQ